MQDHRLTIILRNAEPTALPAHLLGPASRFSLMKVRAFVDLVANGTCGAALRACVAVIDRGTPRTQLLLQHDPLRASETMLIIPRVPRHLGHDMRLHEFRWTLRVFPISAAVGSRRYWLARPSITRQSTHQT